MPLTILTSPERRTKTGMLPSLVWPDQQPGTPDSEGWYAEVRTDGGTVYQVSRLDGETGWTADAAFAAGSSFPVFVNGYGARYLRTRRLDVADAAELDWLTLTDEPSEEASDG